MRIMNESKKNIRQVDKNVLDLLWKLTTNKSNNRIDATADILNILQKKQDEVGTNEPTKDLTYTVERLIKGLASSRDSARLGFSLLLTEILKHIDAVDIEEVLSLIDKHISNNAQHEKKDIAFGELFAYSAIVRSGKLPEHSHLSFVAIQIFNLWHGKNENSKREYIVNACYEILMDLFSQLSPQKFKESVWPQLKDKLAVGFETSLWPVMLCIRMFPEVVSEKYIKKHWQTADLFSSDNFEHHKKIIKSTTASLPMLHPYCQELVRLFETRKDMKEFWNAVVDEILFEMDFSEKTYVGFEMVKKVFEGNPKKKIIKVVFSPKFRALFTKCLFNQKHPMNPAAEVLAQFLSDFVKQNSDPEVQLIVLKVFLQPPGTLLSDKVFQQKEVSALIQNLLPDAVKSYFELLKTFVIKNHVGEDDDSVTSKKHVRTQAIVQIGALVNHPTMTTDIDWRLSVIKFLFLYSYFKVNQSIDLDHCEEMPEDIPAEVRGTFSDMFFKTLNSLQQRTTDNTAPLEKFLQNLTVLSDYVDQIMSANEAVTSYFPLEKVQESWQQMKTIVHKLGKQSKKDGKTDESRAFQALFLELGFHLFRDPQHMPEVFEELHICCKKALQARKNAESTEEENEPSWIGVVVDILLSLLSRDSNPLRSVVTSVFPLFCPFMNEDALKQILDVINPEKAKDDAMLVDESGEDSDVDFESGSSSSEEEEEEESHSNEKKNSKADEAFREKVKEALGAAADVSDAESIALSDSEMFKMDDMLAQAFKSRIQEGHHTQLSEKDKAMLNFRVRCLDLIMEFLKSEPPMQLVMLCIQPLLAAYDYGHKGRNQTALLNKVISTMKILTKIKKFQNQDNVDKSQMKELLESLIAKCHKETNLDVANRLYALSVFLVLCFRRLESSKSPGKQSKKASYMKIYLSALEAFVKGSSSHAYPQLFVSLMEACPDLAWNFIQPCQQYAFDDGVRIYKKTQCFGLICEALKYSKSQAAISSEDWLEVGNSFVSQAVETLKSTSAVKPANLTELLNVVNSFYSIVKDKTGQSLLENRKDLLPVLMELDKTSVKKLTKAGNSLRRKLIIALGGKIVTKKSKNRTEAVQSQNDHTEASEIEISDNITSTEQQDFPKVKSNKRKSLSKESNKKKVKADSLSNGIEEGGLTNGTENGEEISFTETPHKKKSKSKKRKQEEAEIEGF